jgi:phosphoglycerol transferase MdoB-like AlkP superfamily enzyme
MMLPRFAARKVQKMNTAVHRLPWNASLSLAGLPPRRYALVLLIAGIYCAVSGATRVVLALKALAASQIAVSELTNILLIGTGYDIVASLYLCAPLILYLLLLPERIFHGRAHRVAAWGLFALVVYGLTYLGAVEYFFFDEFNSRFNFVAVEYLIYPHEVFVNIWESYPVGKVLFASVIVTALLLWLLQPRIAGALAARSRISQRLASAGWLLAALAAVHIGLDINSGHAGQNRVADEIAANGVYSFFNAAVNNHLDYTQFYLNVSDSEAAARVRRLVAQPNTTFLPDARNPLARHVQYAGTVKPLHVIVLLQESLGAEFVGAYGDKRGLTPNLDRIARDSLVFTNTYATGTRTVRGMEAVAASFPPVPAESIVKRQHNEGMFNWSTVMNKNGYSPTFIYGGYGTFDNMNNYFGNNGYRVIDRTDMDQSGFSNIWGVSDEDLFRNAFRVFDEQHARGERIFSIVMSTSNHKPFTFPEGIEGVKPKGGGREAGIRYADYAIGRFIEQLRQKPYFENTMVVIVADHGARVYGREDIPLPSYEIPFLVYSPKHVAPRRTDTLTGQIDIAPTVLGLLNMSYDSVFFGRDVLADTSIRHFALLNHNRDIALFRNGRLDGLGFRNTHTARNYDTLTRSQSPAEPDQDSTKDAASIYQLAYKLYANRDYRLH